MKAKTRDLEGEAVRSALLAIVERNNGVLNPHDVLAAARDPQHILHHYFEWDDSTAAEAYRLAQVAALIRRVRLTIVRSDAKTRSINISTTRAFQSRPSMRSADGGYERIDAILSDAEKRAELLAQVLREIVAYRRRYAELSELQAVWVAVDEAATEILPDTSPLSPPDNGEARPGAAV